MSEGDYNATYVEGLLDECKAQLKLGPPSLKIKTLLRKMQEIAAPPTPPSALKKKPANPPPETAAMITVECSVCGQERPSSFFKRGFKCLDCRGHHGQELGTPQSSSASLVPSLKLRKGFHFAPVSELEESSKIAAGGDDIDPHVPPAVKYTVFTVPYKSSLNPKVKLARTKISHPNVACIFATCVDKTRDLIRVVHETAVPLLDSAQSGVDNNMQNSASFCEDRPFASTFSSFSAVKRQPSEFTVGGGGESSVDGGSFNNTNNSNASIMEIETGNGYEKMKKIVLSCLHGLAYLHHQGFIHNDLRPHNILVDPHHNIKLRYAPFGDAPMPPPYGAPELQLVPADGAKVRATKESDIYMLGVTLSVISYGSALEFPSEHDQTADDVQLIHLLSQMTHPNPAERISIVKALASGYLSSVRFVNGMPVETQIANVGIQPSSSSAHIELGGDHASEETKDLVKFFADHGPAFQVIRGPTHLTLYSVKSDPRRRRAKTMMQATSEENLARKRSITLPTMK